MMPLANDKKYTYSDYLGFPENERWEIIGGVPYMQAASSWQHQAVSREIMRQFSNYLSSKSCQVFAAPFDLRIPEESEKDEDSSFVVQPDILVICDKAGLVKTGYSGIPVLIVEISSPSTAKFDKILKFNKYENAGVSEYWIVEPESRIVSVFTLQDNGRFGRPEFYSETDKVSVTVFSDFVVDLKPVFENISY